MGRARGSKEKFGLGERDSIGVAMVTALRIVTSKKLLKERTTILS